MLDRRRLVVIVVLVVLVVLGGGSACDPFAPPPPPIEAPFSEHLVSGRLPFEVAGLIPLPNSIDTVATGNINDVGPDVGLSLFYEGGGYVQLPGSLVAVAALPDRLVVVYPSAAQVGFDVAVGGLDLPWTSRHLSDVPRERAGAIDAIADNDGGVYVALRERYAPGPGGPGTPMSPAPVHFFTLAHDGALISDEVIPGLEQVLPWYEDRCPDVQIGVSLAGDVDVIVLGPRHARRAAGSTFWDIQQLDIERFVDFSQVVDVGCRNRIAYDEADLPQLLSLSRLFPVTPSEAPPPPLAADVLPVNHFGANPANLPVTATLGFFVGGDGVWRSASRGPNASLAFDHPWHEGGFDVETHPDGYVMSGPELSTRDVKFKITSFVREAGTLARLDEEINLNPQDPFFEANMLFKGNTEKMHFSACGGLETRGSGRPYAVEGLRSNFSGGAFGFLCLYEPHAPAFFVPPSEPAAERSPVYAHGRRPYNVGVCLTEKAELSVCVNAETAREVLRASDAPLIVTTDPVDGAGDVNADTNTLVFQFDRDLSALRATVQLADVTLGQLFFVGTAEQRIVVEVSGNTVTARLPTGLRTGDRYRASVLLSDSKGNAFTYVGQEAPVVHFTVPGRVLLDDLRFVSTPECSATAAFVDGVCLAGDQISINAGTVLIVPTDYDQRHNNVGNLQLTDPVGTRVSVTVEQKIFPAPDLHHLFVTINEQLQVGTRYTLTIPPNARNSYGAPILDEDRVYAFSTAP